MKVVLTGATGGIGSAILRHCLRHPSITSIIALSRKPLSVTDPKLTTIIVESWKEWDSSIIAQIVDADAAIWAIGTTDANKDINYNYPLAFQDAVLQARKGRLGRFRFIRVSGAFTELDQNKTLWFYSAARKLHGTTEAKNIEFARAHRDVWQCFVVKPGGVVKSGDWAMKLGSMLGGKKNAITDEELGVFVAHLVVEGDEEEGRVFNETMVVKGRQLLNAAPSPLSGI